MTHQLALPRRTKDCTIVATTGGPAPIPVPANIDMPPDPDPCSTCKLTA